MEENDLKSQEEIKVREEDEDLRELIQAQMQKVMTTTKDATDKRERLMKIELSEEIGS